MHFTPDKLFHHNNNNNGDDDGDDEDLNFHYNYSLGHGSLSDRNQTSKIRCFCKIDSLSIKFNGLNH